LIASVVFSGVWSGLLAMLTMVMHPMLARMDGAEFARFLRAFLPAARKALG
jgi:putative copper export protein